MWRKRTNRPRREARRGQARSSSTRGRGAPTGRGRGGNEWLRSECIVCCVQCALCACRPRWSLLLLLLVPRRAVLALRDCSRRQASCNCPSLGEWREATRGGATSQPSASFRSAVTPPAEKPRCSLAHATHDGAPGTQRTRHTPRHTECAHPSAPTTALDGTPTSDRLEKDPPLPPTIHLLYPKLANTLLATTLAFPV